jgi:FixJ family two-component response regulator
MTMAKATVLVVDDDVSVRRALERLMRSVGLTATTFASAQEFLQCELPLAPTCLVLDVRMPETSGLDLQNLLATTGFRIPIIFLTGHGTVPVSVQAMKAGAIDFLQKPCDDQTLLQAIYRALHQAQQAWSDEAERQMLHQRLQTLTPREHDVFTLVVTGRLNKQIAAALGLSEKTVKIHRARVMQKMHAVSLAELVRMSDKLGIKLEPLSLRTMTYASRRSSCSCCSCLPGIRLMSYLYRPKVRLSAQSPSVRVSSSVRGHCIPFARTCIVPPRPSEI